MKLSTLNTFAAAIVIMAASVLARPAHAATPEAAPLACTASQIAEVQQYIANTCDGGGSVRVYCSWTGLWETRSAVQCA